MKNELKARLEMAMMTGKAVPISKNDVRDVLEYCLPAIITSASKAKITNLAEDSTQTIMSAGMDVIAVSFSHVLDMPVINFVFSDTEYMPISYDELKGEEEPTIAYCYVLNCEEEAFSEFGSTGYKNYKRVY